MSRLPCHQPSDALKCNVVIVFSTLMHNVPFAYSRATFALLHFHTPTSPQARLTRKRPQCRMVSFVPAAMPYISSNGSLMEAFQPMVAPPRDDRVDCWVQYSYLNQQRTLGGPPIIMGRQLMTIFLNCELKAPAESHFDSDCFFPRPTYIGPLDFFTRGVCLMSQPPRYVSETSWQQLCGLGTEGCRW
jgi:hypothetical protein